MAKPALSGAIALVLLVAAQGRHTSSLQDSTSSSSSNAGSSVVESVWSGHNDVNAGDSTTDKYIDSRDGSSLSHETSITGVLSLDVESSSSSSNSERASMSTTAPAVAYVFSSSSPQSSSATLSPSNDASSSTASPTPVQADASYSAGTVEPSEEREAVESTALKFSTSSDQVNEPADTSSPASTPTSSSDKKATSTDPTGHDDTNNLRPSESSFASPLVYTCIVLCVAGLVGTLFTFRAKSKRDVSRDWRAASEAAAVTPPMSRVPPVSQVRVIIDDNNFALL